MKGTRESGRLQSHSRAVLGNSELAWLVRALTPLLCASVWVTCVRMAEQEPTAEQLAQIAAENEEDEHSVNYKPPAQKSIQEIQELDKDDESLRKYKEALLGAVTVSAGEPWHVLVPSGLASAPSWELFSQLCLGRSTAQSTKLCLCSPTPIAGVQGLRGGGGTLPLQRTLGWARCSGRPDPYQRLFLLVFVLFQEVPWKEKELCWPVSGVGV